VACAWPKEGHKSRTARRTGIHMRFDLEIPA
jgi:hypothetical protein